MYIADRVLELFMVVFLSCCLKLFLVYFVLFIVDIYLQTSGDYYLLFLFFFKQKTAYDI